MKNVIKKRYDATKKTLRLLLGLGTLENLILKKCYDRNEKSYDFRHNTTPTKANVWEMFR